MKKSIRLQALSYRKQLDPGEASTLARQIILFSTTLLQTFKPCTVGLYYPTRGEPEILDILGMAASLGIECSLPVCADSPAGSVLRFARFKPTDPLENGRYDIPVPVHKNWVQPDVLLIPCVAFHRRGVRLGYGAGWYDRTLAQSVKRPVTVGIAYSATESQLDFSENHDQILDYVVTDQEVITCTGQNDQ